MAKDKETPEEVDELSGWRKLHQDYLEKKEREAKEKKEKDDKERREKLKAVPKRPVKSEEEENEPILKTEAEEEIEEDAIPEIPFLGEKVEEEEKPSKPIIPLKHRLRALSVLLFFSLTSLVSLYFITPLGSLKNIRVSGNNEVTTEAVLTASAIQNDDYALTTFLSQKGYERNILDSSPWIQAVSMTYQFPNNFSIQVKEYDVVAFEVRDQGYYPILANGAVVETARTAETAQNKPLIRFSDAEKIKQLVEELAKMPDSLKQSIQSIELTPTNASADLLTLTMTGEHKVLVPLSDLSRKLSYYESIVSQLTEASVVDMESGIFSYSQAAAAAAAQAQAEEANEQNQETATETTESSQESAENTENLSENTEVSSIGES